MDHRVKYLVSYIRKNYQRKVTLTEMAESVSLSRWGLGHLFKEHVGISPKRFLTQVRMEKAKQLLENEFLSARK